MGAGDSPSGEGRARVLLADSHTLILAALRVILEPGFAVVGQVADGDALVGEALRLRPDLVVTDVRLPALTGLEKAGGQIETGQGAP